MENALWNIVVSVMLLFAAIVRYWYVSLPTLIILIILYKKTQNQILKKVLRVVLALVALSVLANIVLYVWEG